MRSKLPVTKRAIFVYDEDWEYLQSRFGPGGVVNSGVSPLLREMIHKFVTRQRQAEADLRDAKQPARQPAREQMREKGN